MTRKNSKKLAARSLKAAKGGRYQARLRQVGGGTSQVQVVPRFDRTDPRNKTARPATGAWQDPMRPVAIISGTRETLVRISPHSEGRAGWRIHVTHQAGTWPLADAERAAVEVWIEAFASTEWPDREQMWPALYEATRQAWGRGPGLSQGTKRVLHLLLGRWQEASDAESDPEEHEAFGQPIGIVRQAISQPNATHEEIRRAIDVCPAYPNFGPATLRELADAERDGHKVLVTERDDGAISWRIVRSDETPGYPFSMGGNSNGNVLRYDDRIVPVEERTVTTLRPGETWEWSTPENTTEIGHLEVTSDADLRTLRVEKFESSTVVGHGPGNVMTAADLHGETVKEAHRTSTRLRNMGPTDAHVDVRWRPGRGTKHTIEKLLRRLA
jgi:hypothetical protein